MTPPPRPLYRWQLRSRTLELGARTFLMAIINVTPDSFSGDGLAGLPIDDAIAAAVVNSFAFDAGRNSLPSSNPQIRVPSIATTAIPQCARLTLASLSSAAICAPSGVAVPVGNAA